MKIAYLTWGSTPRSYGIFQSQVINQYVAIKDRNPEWQYDFISAVPLLHSGLLKNKLEYFKDLSKVKESLKGIAFHSFPIYAPQNFINSSKLTFNMMHYGAQSHLATIIKKIKPDIVHCRSYHATWAATQVRERYKFSYKVIFDARGLWPEEVAFGRGYALDSKDYLYLKEIEEKIIKQSDKIISVSLPMKREYELLGAFNVENIYLSASVAELTRQQRQATKSHTVLCYVGTLSRDTWHRPKYLADLYQKFRNEVKNPKLLIVTKSHPSTFLGELNGIPSDEIEIGSAQTTAELAHYLSMADFGALSYFVPKKAIEKKLAETILAVKTAEYLSAGVPMLVNRYCGGARDIVDEFGVGISYDPESLTEICQERLNRLLEKSVSSTAKNISTNLFDYQANAERYSNIYESLL